MSKLGRGKNETVLSPPFPHTPDEQADETFPCSSSYVFDRWHYLTGRGWAAVVFHADYFDHPPIKAGEQIEIEGRRYTVRRVETRENGLGQYGPGVGYLIEGNPVKSTKANGATDDH